MFNRNHIAMVLFSGGMDSTVALYWALNTFDHVEGITFDYDQSHVAEVGHAHDIWSMASRRHGYTSVADDLRYVHLPNTVFNAPSSILRRTGIAHYTSAADAAAHNQDDPAYLPLRNAVLLALAASHLLTISPSGGVLVTGFRGRPGPGGGYPDGSPQFSDALTTAFSLGAFGAVPSEAQTQGVWVWDPLNRPGRSRADALRLARDFRGCFEALSYSMTCFEGVEPPCGTCLPCLRRAEGFREYGVPDPLIERMRQERKL